MPSRVGRPPSENPKIHDTRIRMSDNDIEKLDYCCEFFKLNKAEIIRQGINEMYLKAITVTDVALPVKKNNALNENLVSSAIGIFYNQKDSD